MNGFAPAFFGCRDKSCPDAKFANDNNGKIAASIFSSFLPYIVFYLHILNVTGPISPDGGKSVSFMSFSATLLRTYMLGFALPRRG